MTHGMTCKELVELVTEYFEGTLPPGERERFEAHLSTCKGCQGHLMQMKQTIALLGRLPEEIVPEEAKEELLSLFRNWKAGEKNDPPAPAE